MANAIPLNRIRSFGSALFCAVLVAGSAQGQDSGKRRYDNRLTPIAKPQALLADYPEFVEPIRSKYRFAAPPLIDEEDGDLLVRAWRFSYNARGIIEVPNRLSAKRTAIVVVHPWGIDDGQGWNSPQPAGVAFFCTPEKNAICIRHLEKVVNPFLKKWRGKVGLVAYSLPGKEDRIRKKLYRSFRSQPTAEERRQGERELAAKLKSFRYRGRPLPDRITVEVGKAAVGYFKSFPGLEAGAKYNGGGFWQLPIPVSKPIEVAPRDVVIYDGDGYDALKTYLKKQGIRHVLLAGYATDMCVCKTTAGYENLSKDFNVFLVGDATLATFPAADTPRFATSTALAKASLNLFITQVSWIRERETKAGR